MIDLETWWYHFWQNLGDLGFVMVIIGVAAEGVELVVKWIERRRGSKVEESKMKWMLPFESVFFGVLILGLAMEFLGGHNAMKISEAANTRLNKEAGSARQEAGAALERAALVESNNLVLRTKVVALEQAAMPRRITLDTRNKFISLTKSLQKGLVYLNLAYANKESFQFAQDLFCLIKDAGYDAPGDPANRYDYSDVMPGGTHSAEVQVTIADGKHVPLFATELADALHVIGVDVCFSENPGIVASNSVALVVWPKK